jgi:molybdate transport system ATP-binding protein
MATQPRLLLLDEPLASLDATRRQEIMPWLERLRDELHLPMLYVTHAADEVARLSQTLLIMAQGQLKACGATVQTLNREWFAMHGAESAAALFDATVVALDPTWHLALVQCSGMALWLRDTGFRVGQSVRVSLNADDVSLTLEAAKETSIQNHVPVEVVSLQPDTHPAHVWIHLRAQESNLWARLTARSVYELALTPGMRVWAQIKSVALVK